MMNPLFTEQHLLTEDNIVVISAKTIFAEYKDSMLDFGLFENEAGQIISYVGGLLTNNCKIRSGSPLFALEGTPLGSLNGVIDWIRSSTPLNNEQIQKLYNTKELGIKVDLEQPFAVFYDKYYKKVYGFNVKKTHSNSDHSLFVHTLNDGRLLMTDLNKTFLDTSNIGKVLLTDLSPEQKEDIFNQLGLDIAKHQIPARYVNEKKSSKIGEMDQDIDLGLVVNQCALRAWGVLLGQCPKHGIKVIYNHSSDNYIIVHREGYSSKQDLVDFLLKKYDVEAFREIMEVLGLPAAITYFVSYPDYQKRGLHTISSRKGLNVIIKGKLVYEADGAHNNLKIYENKGRHAMIYIDLEGNINAKLCKQNYHYIDLLVDPNHPLNLTMLKSINPPELFTTAL